MVDSNGTPTKYWRGKKSPSPLLLSPKAMELVLTKERMRCDRYGQFFSLIVFQPNMVAGVESTRQLRLIAKILHRRLRLTDEKGLLLKGGLGVLLPMTELDDAKIVLDSIVQMANRFGVTFDAEVFAYIGKETFPKPYSEEESPSDLDSNIVFDDELIAEESIVENAASISKSAVATAVTPFMAIATVRADDLSQFRGSGAGKILSTVSVASKHVCPRYPTWKRSMDVCFALSGLVVSAPVIFVVAIAIKLSSRGPVFFRQMRTGQFGVAFPIYKLRTMVVDAEELKEKLHQLNERDGPAFKMKNDPRVTTLGGWLRKTGIDELPQLWNVLVGNMAIVGPRPLPCNEDSKCKIWHRRRLDTKPGLTCTWQISKSRKVSFSEWMRMDLRYSDNRTIVGDIGLMFKTVLAVFLGRVGH